MFALWVGWFGPQYLMTHMLCLGRWRLRRYLSAVKHWSSVWLQSNTLSTLLVVLKVTCPVASRDSNLFDTVWLSSTRRPCHTACWLLYMFEILIHIVNYKPHVGQGAPFPSFLLTNAFKLISEQIDFLCTCLLIMVLFSVCIVMNIYTVGRTARIIFCVHCNEYSFCWSDSQKGSCAWTVGHLLQARLVVVDVFDLCGGSLLEARPQGSSGGRRCVWLVWWQVWNRCQLTSRQWMVMTSKYS